MEKTPKYIDKLHSRRVLVIGGTSGIGLCVAEAALEHGAIVTISGSTESKLQTALTHLNQSASPLRHNHDISGPAISGHTCDLSHPASQESALRSLLQATTADGKSKLDHVVFTAGNNISIPSLEEVTAELVQAMQSVRILAPIMLAKLLPAYVTKSAHSSLTLTGGTQAIRPSPAWSVMAGIMSSISGLTRGFAVDLQPIRVNAVFPGAVKSTAANHIDPAILEKAMANFRSTTLTGTVGMPEEVAEAYLYFMKSSYASGTTVVVDGGKLLKG
ncbi:hypothetical protein CERZMDRAFT_115680 [Cercospora zeae-maydis SCOH1-5]|uniref:Ketoreductase (KR) domain-containing protein n=1 Tax=Cercospora zeae-maydis SCOH1-5 TaxID=717836 RepID=A0A6A6EZS4_9PEZI|nr:hypothetical protein CERZMDRAFT_115680 [Cercospora zeae-maydis SCOH1-5]